MDASGDKEYGIFLECIKWYTMLMMNMRERARARAS